MLVEDEGVAGVEDELKYRYRYRYTCSFDGISGSIVEGIDVGKRVCVRKGIGIDVYTNTHKYNLACDGVAGVEGFVGGEKGDADA